MIIGRTWTDPGTKLEYIVTAGGCASCDLLHAVGDEGRTACERNHAPCDGEVIFKRNKQPKEGGRE